MAPDDISEILAAIREGRSDAVRDLLPIVYDELHAMAHRRLGAGGRDVVLDTTVLVHETYLKLFARTPPDLHDRRHFFSVAAIAMRQIVVDHVRRRSAARRGGGAQHLELDASQIAIEEQSGEILALDEALSRLFRLDESLARIVELRFFGGLTVEEVAEVMDLSVSTVKREWRKARAWLYQELKRDEDP